MGKNIGFVSTRFAGTDGVTLESSKWAQVIKKADIPVSGLPVNLTEIRKTAFWYRKLSLSIKKING
ncbi:MAG: hypothetical protein JRE64_16770 [Deltaproteobacteria bacterium]|nr:hypothetical protein [Deltaproteobacteria bacterium]